jgi:hypothetical protein
MMVTKTRLLWTVLLLVACARALAFPELVRRGYANCVTCHYSPTGGGLLTAYGRSLSAEVLSSAGSADEGKFLYGAVNPPDWVGLGGDFRFLQTFLDADGGQISKFIVMQADLEGAVTAGRVTVDATAGVDFQGQPISRRHYLLYHATDELSFRAGRFMPAYGINTEDHALAIKRGIGKDQSTETYNVEAAWIAENFDVFVTGILGRPDNLSLGAETGAAASASVFLDDRFKVGASYYYGYRNIARRQLAGPWAILGFAPRCFVLAELDFQWLTPAGASGGQTGAVDDLRLDFEVLQGLHLYLTQELSQLDFSTGNSFSDAYGVGVQFFPRPHYEINALYQRLRVGGTASSWENFIWGLLHVYL